MAADLADPPVGAASRTSRAASALSLVIVVLLGLLAVEVMLEGWIQEILGNRYLRTVDVDPAAVLRRLGGELPDWPKTLKNGLLLTLVAVSVLKVALERRWREFSTRADLALAVLALIMVVAGLLGTSGPLLIGQALFVYFRGAIVFYAVRALRPDWRPFRPVLWAAGVVIAIDVVVALVQMVFGWRAYSALGWVDPAWAEIHRAQGLFDHPNHLGHVLGLVLIGLIAWMSGLEKIGWKWWAAFGAAALGLAATQSRESAIGALIAVAVVWYLRRGGGRAVLIGSGVIVLLFAANMLVRPENLAEIKFRLQGVSDAFSTPSGTENCDDYETIKQCTDAGAAPSREIRFLFVQQGMDLLWQRPVFGYGVGQFGGIVAEQHDPNWEKDPRFGPDGFHLYDFEGTTVDSFWLHLVVEVGLLGLAAYLIWLVLLAAPLVRASRRFDRSPVRGPPADEDGSGTDPTAATGLWAVGSIIFAALVAVLSPALEDPLFPPLVFGIIGLAWALASRRSPSPASATPTTSV
jgi:hypothetical protein